MSRSDQAGLTQGTALAGLTYSDLLHLVEDVIVGENSILQTGYTRMEDLQIQDVKETNPELLKEILGTKLRYLGHTPTHVQTSSDQKGITWEHRWIRYGSTKDEPQSMLRIVQYPEAGETDKMCNPVINNATVRAILSDFRINRILDTIACPICNLDADGEELSEYEEIAQKINAKGKYLIQATELWHQMITLEVFLTKYELNLLVWKNILAKLINTIAVIVRQYPDYRHGYFVPEYIDCYVKKDHNGTDHAMPKLGMHYRSCMLPSSTRSDDLAPDLARTSYSDIWKLLSYLWNHYHKSIEKHAALVEIFHQLYPESIRSKDPYLTQKSWDTLSETAKAKLHPSQIMTAAIFQSDDQVQGNKKGFQENQLSRNGATETEFQRINRISEKMARNGHHAPNKIRRVVIAGVGNSEMPKSSKPTKYMSRLARADLHRTKGSDIQAPVLVGKGTRPLLEAPTLSRMSRSSPSEDYSELLEHLAPGQSGSQSFSQTVGSRMAQTFGVNGSQGYGQDGMHMAFGQEPEFQRPMPGYPYPSPGVPAYGMMPPEMPAYGVMPPQGPAYGMPPGMPTGPSYGMPPSMAPPMAQNMGYPAQMQYPMAEYGASSEEEQMQRYLAAGQIGGTHPSTYNQKQASFFRQPPVTGQGRK